MSLIKMSERHLLAEPSAKTELTAQISQKFMQKMLSVVFSLLLGGLI